MMDIVRLVQKFFLYAEKEAIHYQDQIISYRTLFDNIMLLANGFHFHGLKQGDFIAVYLENSPDFIYAFYAAFMNGLTVLPIAEQLGADEVRRVIQTTGCKTILTSTSCYANLKDEPFFEEALDDVIVLGLDDNKNSLDWAADIIGSKEHRALSSFLYHFDSSRFALMYFTSGSTGKPKGVVHDYEFVLNVGPFYKKHVKYSKEDKVLIMTTLGYVIGSVYQMMGALYGGSSILLYQHFEPRQMLDGIMNKKITTTCSTPSQLADVISLAGGVDCTNNHLRAFYCGGNLVSVELIESFKQTFDKNLTQIWGMTECLNGMFNDNKNPSKIGSLGRPFEDIHICVINEKGQEVMNGEVGELCIKTPMLFKEYFNDQDTTNKAIVCGFLKTGDLVIQDEDHYVWFKGRKKNIIVCGASNIAPEEVEDALKEHCGLMKSCVIGEEDPNKGQVPIAILEGEENFITIKDIKQKLQGKLAHYKIPRSLYFIPHFPSLSSGKIDRKQLKKILLNNK